MAESAKQQRIDKTVDAVESIADSLIEKLESREKEYQELPKVDIKYSHILIKADIPRSTYYQDSLNYRLNSRFEWVEYIKDTGKFKLNLEKYQEIKEAEKDGD